MLKKIRIICGILGLGVCAGVAAQYLLKEQNNQKIESKLNFALPEEGIQTDEFSLRLFREAVLQSPGESVILCPALVADALQQIKDLSAPPVQQEIQQQQLCHPTPEHTVTPRNVSLLAADYNLNYAENYQELSLMRLPIRSNYPIALELINAQLISESNVPRQPIADRKTIPLTAQFIAAIACGFSAELQSPFLSANSVVGNFENADGSLPQISMMRVRAHFRYAKDSAGQWEVVALPLRPHPSGGGVPTVLLGILPTGDAEKMAASFTREQLTAIRKELLEASPRDCTVEFPQIIWSPEPRDITPLLQRLGLRQMFSRTENNWIFSNQPLAMDAVLEKLHLEIISRPGHPDQQANPNNAAHTVTFNRPFIWMIGDLSTSAQPYFMGLLQNM